MRRSLSRAERAWVKELPAPIGHHLRFDPADVRARLANQEV